MHPGSTPRREKSGPKPPGGRGSEPQADANEAERAGQKRTSRADALAEKRVVTRKRKARRGTARSGHLEKLPRGCGRDKPSPSLRSGRPPASPERPFTLTKSSMSGSLSPPSFTPLTGTESAILGSAKKLPTVHAIPICSAERGGDRNCEGRRERRGLLYRGAGTARWAGPKWPNHRSTGRRRRGAFPRLALGEGPNSRRRRG